MADILEELKQRLMSGANRVGEALGPTYEKISDMWDYPLPNFMESNFDYQPGDFTKYTESLKGQGLGGLPGVLLDSAQVGMNVAPFYGAAKKLLPAAAGQVAATGGLAATLGGLAKKGVTKAAKTSPTLTALAGLKGLESMFGPDTPEAQIQAPEQDFQAAQETFPTENTYNSPRYSKSAAGTSERGSRNLGYDSNGTPNDSLRAALALTKMKDNQKINPQAIAAVFEPSKRGEDLTPKMESDAISRRNKYLENPEILMGVLGLKNVKLSPQQLAQLAEVQSRIDAVKSTYPKRAADPQVEELLRAAAGIASQQTDSAPQESSGPGMGTALMLALPAAAAAAYAMKKGKMPNAKGFRGRVN